MSTPTSIPTFFRPGDVVASGRDWRASFRAMASNVAVTLGPDSQHPDEMFTRLADLFAAVETECTRFDPTSDLMRANLAGQGWCQVGRYCYDALNEAFRAYVATDAMFDPRVLETLQRLGYRNSVQFGAGDGGLDLDGSDFGADLGDPPCGQAPWAPDFDPTRTAVRVGPRPVDLGGIGKGLAVRWAAERIAADSPSFLLDAGGDCYARGPSPDGGPWHIGVEDPLGGERPRAVLAVTDAACVTSSIRLRQWRVAGRPVHHLIDPRTGEPGGQGLLSVTVVGSDPAEAEVWSKVFFLHGRDGIADAVAPRDDVAVLWICADGTVDMNEAMRPVVIWRDEQ